MADNPYAIRLGSPAPPVPQAGRRSVENYLILLNPFDVAGYRAGPLPYSGCQTPNPHYLFADGSSLLPYRSAAKPSASYPVFLLHNYPQSSLQWATAGCAGPG